MCKTSTKAKFELKRLKKNYRHMQMSLSTVLIPSKVSLLLLLSGKERTKGALNSIVSHCLRLPRSTTWKCFLHSQRRSTTQKIVKYIEISIVDITLSSPMCSPTAQINRHRIINSCGHHWHTTVVAISNQRKYQKYDVNSN